MEEPSRPFARVNPARRYDDQQPPQRRQGPEIQPHTGNCTVQEINSLKDCSMNGTRPFANLIYARYAMENRDGGNWYLTDAGFEQIRQYTIRNPQANARF